MFEFVTKPEMHIIVQGPDTEEQDLLVRGRLHLMPSLFLLYIARNKEQHDEIIKKFQLEPHTATNHASLYEELGKETMSIFMIRQNSRWTFDPETLEVDDDTATVCGDLWESKQGEYRDGAWQAYATLVQSPLNIEFFLHDRAEISGKRPLLAVSPP